MNRILKVAWLVFVGLALACATGFAITDGSGDPTAVKPDKGAWTDKDGSPTFKVEDGKVDWYTYIGFTRYSAECLRCHGPDGMGSTYAPALIDSMKRLSYMDFYTIVASGKKDVSASQELVMPALGTDKNVMCFISEIYTYLRARSDGAVDRGRPEKHEPKPVGFEQDVDQCMG